MLNILDSFASLNNMLINIEKTELLVLTLPDENITFAYNNSNHILRSVGKNDSIRFLSI